MENITTRVTRLRKAYLKTIGKFEDLKILSIDFDVVMLNQLQAYNYKCSSSKKSDKDWMLLSKKHKLGMYRPDKEIYEQIKKLCLQSEILVVRQDHEAIAEDVIESGAHCELISNIDFHHDVEYESSLVKDKGGRLTCANWMGYLMKSERADHTEWFRTSHTDWLDESKKKFKDKFTVRELSDIYNIDPSDYDVTYLIRSPGWVPNSVGKKCDEIVIAYNKLHGDYNTLSEELEAQKKEEQRKETEEKTTAKAEEKQAKPKQAEPKAEEKQTKPKQAEPKAEEKQTKPKAEEKETKAEEKETKTEEKAEPKQTAEQNTEPKETETKPKQEEAKPKQEEAKPKTTAEPKQTAEQNTEPNSAELDNASETKIMAKLNEISDTLASMVNSKEEKNKLQLFEDVYKAKIEELNKLHSETIEELNRLHDKTISEYKKIHDELIESYRNV